MSLYAAEDADRSEDAQRADLASEMAVLGWLIDNRDHAAVAEVWTLLAPEDFYRPAHIAIARVCQTLFLNGEPVDPARVFQECVTADIFRMLGGQGAGYLHSLIQYAAVGAANANWHVKRIVEAARVRETVVLATRTLQQLANPNLDLLCLLTDLGDEVAALQVCTSVSIDLGLTDFPDFLEIPPQETDFVIPGLLGRREKAIFTGAEGIGKLLRVDEPVPTPQGWTTMGALQPGDRVLDRHGRPCSVTWVSGVEPSPDSWALVFSDGTRIEADANHQWWTFDYAARQRADSTPRVVTTWQIQETLMARGGHTVNHAIPVAGALQLPHADLPIPPYTLGAWLGDGTTASGVLTLNRFDAPTIEAGVSDDGLSHHRIPSGDREGSVGVRVEGLSADLHAAWILGHKRIPAAYLRASEDQRWDLLAGLLDTDGSIVKPPAVKGRGGGAATCELTLTCKPLVDGALELIRSLGIKVGIAESDAKLNGRVVGRRWRMTFQSTVNPFRVPRKADRWIPLRTRRALYRYVTAVEKVAPTPMRCIAVDSPDRSYLVGEAMVPTHNSTIFRQLALAAASGLHPFSREFTEPKRVLWLDAENHEDTSRELFRRIYQNSVIPQGRTIHKGMLTLKHLRSFDLLSDRDITWATRVVTDVRPDLIYLGPLYQVVGGSLNDEVVAQRVVRVLNRLCHLSGAAMILEAHAGHGKGAGGTREWRPRGSSVLLGWPDFGFGLGLSDDPSAEVNRLIDVHPWRGQRHMDRHWPNQLVKGSAWPFDGY